jgi:hypothetical protein
MASLINRLQVASTSKVRTRSAVGLLMVAARLVADSLSASSATAILLLGLPARADQRNLLLAIGGRGGADAQFTKPAEDSGAARVDASSAGCPANSSGRRMALPPRLAAGVGSARRPLRSRQRLPTQRSKLRLLSWLNAPPNCCIMAQVVAGRCDGRHKMSLFPAPPAAGSPPFIGVRTPYRPP